MRMKRKVEKNWKVNNVMRILKLTLLIIFFTSCKVHKNIFIDEYGEKVLYSRQSHCDIFNYSKKYKGYKSEKCFKIKYNFNSKEYIKLKDLYYTVKFSDEKRRSKKTIKKEPYYSVYKPINEDKDTLVNNLGFGMLYVSGKVFAPNFYFLRTEKDIYFYDCRDKNTLLEKLNESKSIDKKLKSEITLFIEERCNSKDGLKWYSGARFY